MEFSVVVALALPSASAPSVSTLASVSMLSPAPVFRCSRMSPKALIFAYSPTLIRAARVMLLDAVDVVPSMMPPPVISVLAVAVDQVLLVTVIQPVGSWTSLF